MVRLSVAPSARGMATFPLVHHGFAGVFGPRRSRSSGTAKESVRTGRPGQIDDPHDVIVTAWPGGSHEEPPCSISVRYVDFYG